MARGVIPVSWRKAFGDRRRRSVWLIPAAYQAGRLLCSDSILYEGLTGRPPFDAEDRDELFAGILNLDPRPPRQIAPEVPGELARIALKCLAKRMADRYETASDLAADLRRWLASAGVAAGPAPAPP